MRKKRYRKKLKSMKTIGSVTFENARFSTARAFTRNIHYRIYSNTSMTCCKLRTTSLHTHPHTHS